jgi:hypothetical protein
MKRKVKRYDEGGVLTDRYGNEVKSGSGETVKTRYGSSKEDRPTSSGVEDYASLGKRAGVVSPFSGAPSIKEESTTETATPSKSRSETIEEETVAGKGAKNLALEPEEIEVKKKTIVKKKPKYKDTGAKIGSQGDFKMNFPASESSSGMGPRNTFLTRERLEKSKGIFSRMKSGGKVSSASSRADGIAQRGKTKGRMC